MIPSPPITFPELGFYTLPGHTRSPRDLIEEVRQAEALGMSSAWISERFDVKEASALAGAAVAVTEKLFIGTAATNINSRHPLLSASLGSTLHHLSGGRFALGVARGVGIRYDLMGMEKVRHLHLQDFVHLMKKLWRGERVSYDGVLGKFPYLHMSDWIQDDIPLLFVGFGQHSLAFAATLFDGIILHTFLSDETLARTVKLIRDSAEKAGRDPETIKIWSVLATTCEASEEKYLRHIVARMATYLQAPGYGELLVTTNHWDTRILEQFRQHEVVRNMPGAIDSVATWEQLQQIQKLIPEEWLPAATGKPEHCAERFNDQFKAGADGIIIHASQPKEFAPVLKSYQAIRDHKKFSQRSNRPA